ncbi:hypothetical protein AMATHDRAFT_186209 [Amanita thiersii Skay4041]|uniref:Mitotic checkpoint regulator, MAD2B-interacting-domain-containing protein n=1 Tax=Amanita thiersii Skay4041 TaxID=703135 RepID=A0A2A9P108_9AGAR|nr:hypothetical protein AMATHDRAFT_186209 [Amanita thiersii Skay4041]
MLGLELYGSDNDSETENAQAKPSPTPTPKLKRPKKITIGLPSLPSSQNNEDSDELADRPSTKKARTAGAGASSLLSMLPAPKNANPVRTVPERVLGSKTGPGLVFNTSRASLSKPSPAVEETAREQEQNLEDDRLKLTTSTPTFLPPSLARGKANISLEDDGKPFSKAPPLSDTPSVDFFSLGMTGPDCSVSSTSNSSNPRSSSGAPLPKFSAAPEVPTFEPPEPTPNDPYPGYYQLPSGAWAAHDPTYYATFLKKWQSDYDAHVRVLEKGVAKGFEGYENAAVTEVDTAKEMERARIEIKEREERKAVTKGAGAGPSAPKMKITASKMSGIARTRHQLATLLRDAYENREALEEKIAEGRRNRKEAGNKYGESIVGSA